jgi:transposase
MEISLLPATLEIAQILEQPNHVVIHASSISQTASCPACGQSSQSLHSRYARAPDDLAIAEKSVTLHLRVRRYRCRNPDCARVTFAEPFPDLIATRARRTSRLQNVQLQVSLAVGAEAGTRLLQKLHASTSPDTLLRLTRAFPIAPPDTPRVLGVDDFSFRRGRIFGTILVDLEKHKVIDVLEDRDSTSFATWLKAHPGVEIISRDRGQIYAQGATDGAPEAAQVADRWHVLQNLAEAVENWLRRHLKHLKEPIENSVAASADQSEQSSAPDITSGMQQPKTVIRRHNRKTEKNSYLRAYRSTGEGHAKKFELYEQVLQLRDKGFSARRIAEQIGKTKTTVGTWLTKGIPARWRQGKGLTEKRNLPDGLLNPHLEYVKARIETPDVAIKQVYYELLEMGYRGSKSTVYALAAMLRAGWTVKSTGSSSVQQQARYAPREGVWMFVREPKKLEPEESQRLKLLGLEVPEAKRLYDLVQGFARLIRNRAASTAEGLEIWLTDAKSSTIPEVVRFAKGVVKDQAAVLAGMTLEWSNGQVEGQVTRLKLIKRFGFGRAKFDLLRARVLLG